MPNKWLLGKGSVSPLFSDEQEPDRCHDTGKGGHMSPTERFTKDNDHEHPEDAQRQGFLNDLKLARAPTAGIADPVCGHGKRIFDKRQPPTNCNHNADWSRRRNVRAALQMPVPCDRHEDVGKQQQRDNWHYELSIAAQS
jgi:hypothetical protein